MNIAKLRDVLDRAIKEGTDLTEESEIIFVHGSVMEGGTIFFPTAIGQATRNKALTGEKVEDMTLQLATQEELMKEVLGDMIEKAKAEE